jgi:hypothetical protein
MKAKEFDARFDAGENVTKHLNLAAARRGGQEIKRVNVDFPMWMLNSLDKEAGRLGVTRQAVVKVLVARHFQAVP